jgi:putative Holliday junction resolvase
MPVLALDVGERRIGLATSDPSETFSLPLGVIERQALRSDLAEIVRIAAERGADTIVIGDPVRLSGERGIAAEKIDRFCVALGRVFGGTLERVDERLTTAQATRTLIAADVSRAKRKKVVDGLAAALILDTFLARRASGKR